MPATFSAALLPPSSPLHHPHTSTQSSPHRDAHLSHPDLSFPRHAFTKQAKMVQRLLQLLDASAAAPHDLPLTVLLAAAAENVAGAPARRVDLPRVTCADPQHARPRAAAAHDGAPAAAAGPPRHHRRRHHHRLYLHPARHLDRADDPVELCQWRAEHLTRRPAHSV